MTITDEDIQKLKNFEIDYNSFKHQKQEFEKYKARELEIVDSKYDSLNNKETEIQEKLVKINQAELELEKKRRQLEELQSKYNDLT